jgi:hypothetical protein
MSINLHCFENMTVPMRCKECACCRTTSTSASGGLSAERISQIMSNRTRDMMIMETPNQVSELVDFDDAALVEYHLITMSEGEMKYIFVTDKQGIFSPLSAKDVIGKKVVEALPKYWYGMLSRYYMYALRGKYKTAMLMKVGMIRLLHTFPIRDKCDNVIGALVLILPPSVRFQAGLEEVDEHVDVYPDQQSMN